MLGFRTTRILVVLTGGVLLLGVCSHAIASDQQLTLPTEWRFEGFIDLTALTMAGTGTDTDPPFGIDPIIIGDADVDFSAGIIATFAVLDRDGNGQPDDGEYAANLQYFRARIGDTSWDESMPSIGVTLEVTDGVTSAMGGNMTCTVPTHPDLEFWLPSSPGRWEARDIRGDHDAGTIFGIYALRAGTVPEPETLSLLAVGALMLICRRRRQARDVVCQSQLRNAA